MKTEITTPATVTPLNLEKLTQSLLNGPFRTAEKALEAIGRLRAWVQEKTDPDYIHPLFNLTITNTPSQSQPWVKFRVADIVILKDSEKSGHFLPLPGAPAMVIGFPCDLQLTDGTLYNPETGSWECEDMIIATETPAGIQAFRVSSQDFQKADDINPEVPTFIREGILEELDKHEAAALAYIEKQNMIQKELDGQIMKDMADPDGQGEESHCGQDADHEA